MIAEITTTTDDIFSFFGPTTSELKPLTDEFYDSAEDATTAILEKYQPELDKKSDKIWNGASTLQQQNWDKKMTEDNEVLMKQSFVIIPIASVVELVGVPKHIRNKA